MSKTAHLVTIGAALLFCTPAWGQQGKTFVVLDLSSPPVLRNLGRVVSMTIAKKADELGATTIDTRTLVADLGRVKVDGAASCGVDAACLGTQLAGVKADRVVAGTFNKTATHYQVRLVHVDLATRQEVSRAERDILIASRALTQEVSAMLPDLLKGEPAKMGLLVVVSEVTGATIKIDGKVRGTTPDARFPVPPGKHQVVIERENYLPLERYVEIAPEGETTFEARLFLIPGREAPTVVAGVVESAETAEKPKTVLRVPLSTWIAGGAAIALAGGGIGMGLKAQGIEKEAVPLRSGDTVLGMTRERALQGKRSATLANLLYGAAGASAAAAVVLTVVMGKTAVKAPDAAAPEGAAVTNLGVAPLSDGAIFTLGGRF